MSELRPCVLVVDDEHLIAQGLCMQIEDMGLTVCGVAASAETAIAVAREHRPRVVLMDVRLRGEMDGVDAANAIGRSVGSKVIFITGSREPATMNRIELAQPSAVLFKPIFGRQLQTAVEEAMSL